ncbi:MAG: polysaccharide biosynthesis protein [Clostridiales bacterium]|nr:polysaccharide biosynthesis protein [Clostridiales bacterium]
MPSVAEKYRIDQIILAIPTATYSERRIIIDECQKTSCDLRIVPAIYQLANGEVNVEKIRNVEIEDLLGRDSIKVDLTEISEHLSGKTVLVTGGGGSIGSELCRQIAKHSPKQLIILDIYENNAYAIQQELKTRYGDSLSLEVIIASVRDIHRIDTIFEKYRPDIVYHAAAHKHVPLMEDSPNEAIKNNVFGTYNVANSASKYGVSSFVLISTDKAVNPTNVMGASKRLCEMIIECFAKISKTKFVAVRFGNVLGSNGSVIPLFKSQIAKGGPVTVTHKDIIRYFMTIPEAVSLVLQSGYYAQGGEIYVLDMGQPVKIDDLARKMIQLSGFKPDIDIKIEYTGLRPGEKLYEELLMSEEGLKKTKNDLIYVGKLSDVNPDEFFTELAYLRDECYSEGDHIKEHVQKLVGTYHPENEGAPINV